VRRAGRETALYSIDWTTLVRPGDLVAWGQSSAEPVALVSSLMEARAAVGGFQAFVGISNSSNVDPMYTDYATYTSYCGTGNNARLGQKLNILPIPYGKLAETLGRDTPVVLLSLAPGNDADHFSYGAAGDYIGDLLHRARLVIAEVSDRTPRTGGGADLRRDQIDLVVRTSSAPTAPPPARLGATDQAVGVQVAGLIQDGATLQIGLGAIPAAVMRALSGHRDLGIHSGLISDEVADLAEAAIITNARKSIDRGVSVAGLLAGGPRLMRWADRNAALALRPTSFTHNHSVLASIDMLAAINSAIEVDLTGQVNSEIAAGRYVGAVGGSGAFLRGALESRGGLPIIALPSTAGALSRIVAQLSGPVSTARADVGLIVTEHGVADLRGLNLRARRERMLRIADPVHRSALDADRGWFAR
jgi:4-hydroxybutyrate CoA-transferase